MKFAVIIQEAGFEPKDYPLASELSIKFYDRKHRLITLSSIHFHEHLFVKSPGALIRFRKFLDEFENELHAGFSPDSIGVRVTENLVTISVDLQPPLILQRN